MPIIFHLISVIFPETSNSRRGLTQNWDYLSDGRQFITQSLGWYRPLFFVGRPIFWTKLYFSFLGGDFFSWSSRWIVRWATPSFSIIVRIQTSADSFYVCRCSIYMILPVYYQLKKWTAYAMFTPIHILANW